MRHLILVLTLLSLALQSIGQQRDKRTPFKEVRYQQNQPLVHYQNTWVPIVKIDTIPVSTLVQMAQTYFAPEWKKGFHRYLHYLLDDIGIERKDSIAVTVRYKNEAITTQRSLEEGNRDIATVRHDSLIRCNRIQRKRAASPDPSYHHLTYRIDGTTPAESNDAWLSPNEIRHDLEYLEWEIENRYSYKDLRGYDYQAAIDVIHHDIQEGMSKRDLAYKLRMFLAPFGDGHTRVSMSNLIRKDELGRLPFQIVSHSGQYLAKSLTDTTLIDPNYPYLESIEGISINQLYDQARLLVAKTSDKYVHNRTLSHIKRIQWLLKTLNIDVDKGVHFTLSNGKSTKDVYLPFKRINRETPHLLRDTLLSNQIAYLSLRYKMSSEDEFIMGLHAFMQKAKDTEGIIIDIRGNGGGSRDALLAVMPYLIKEPTVVNIAHFRINKHDDYNPPLGYLEGRYMMPERVDTSLWDQEYGQGQSRKNLRAIGTFKQRYSPQRLLSKNVFSPAHYMIVHPRADTSTLYSSPVIVLIDNECFSAADIFAGAMKQAPNVTLVGETTGGGSGYSKSRTLPHSALAVKLSRMFSFQPNGLTYDGHGVQPDISVPAPLSDKMGKTDTVLERAVKLMSEY